MRAGFKDLGGYGQVGRALGRLVRQRRLRRLGYGIYSRAVKSRLGGELLPPKGLRTLTEALQCLGR